jgi:hypothetical protein
MASPNHIPQCNQGRAKQLKQRYHADYKVENGNNSSVIGSCPAELRRSRSLSPECSEPIPCLRSSQSMPNFEGSRKDYNRMIGNSLNAESKKVDQDVVAKSLKLMEELLVLVRADSSSPPDHLETQF